MIRSGGDFLGSLTSAGDVRTLRFDGDLLGNAIDVTGSVRRLSASNIWSLIDITGDLGNLTTTSALLEGTGPVAYVFANADADPDGELTVLGTISKIREV